jgi:hypothetical protein
MPRRSAEQAQPAGSSASHNGLPTMGDGRADERTALLNGIGPSDTLGAEPPLYTTGTLSSEDASTDIPAAENTRLRRLINRQ